MTPWDEFRTRLAAWRTDNPGAYPSEKRDFIARLKAELGL